MGDRFLSTGQNCALPMRVPNSSPVLDKNRAPMGPDVLSSAGAGVKGKAPKAFPDSSSVSVAPPAEPRGEKKNFFLCKFWAVKNF